MTTATGQRKIVQGLQLAMVDPLQLAQVIEAARLHRISCVHVVLAHKLIEPLGIALIVSRALGVPVFDLDTADRRQLARGVELPAALCRLLRVLSLGRVQDSEGSHLELAMTDPSDRASVEIVEAIAACPVRTRLVDDEALDRAFARRFAEEIRPALVRVPTAAPPAQLDRTLADGSDGASSLARARRDVPRPVSGMFFRQLDRASAAARADALPSESALREVGLVDAAFGEVASLVRAETQTHYIRSMRQGHSTRADESQLTTTSNPALRRISDVAPSPAPRAARG